MKRLHWHLPLSLKSLLQSHRCHPTLRRYFLRKDHRLLVLEMEVLAAKQSRAVLEQVNVAEMGKMQSAVVLDNHAARISVSLASSLALDRNINLY